jgi:hypothetical protein
MQSSEGGCLCSAVRYRVAGPPLYSVICHCNTCRKASAASSVAWLTFERANFNILAGVPKTFRSSPGVVRTFCAVCGSTLTYTTELRPNQVDMTLPSAALLASPSHARHRRRGARVHCYFEIPNPDDGLLRWYWRAVHSR